MLVERNSEPILRVDLYDEPDTRYVFEDARMWRDLLCIGRGERAYLLDPESKSVHELALDLYFGAFVETDECLLVASASELVRIEPDGAVRWKCGGLGLDGVVVDNVRDGIVFGKGEWDPPGGWKPFRVRLDSGKKTRLQGDGGRARPRGRSHG